MPGNHLWDYTNKFWSEQMHTVKDATMGFVNGIQTTLIREYTIDEQTILTSMVFAASRGADSAGGLQNCSVFVGPNGTTESYRLLYVYVPESFCVPISITFIPHFTFRQPNNLYIRSGGADISASVCFLYYEPDIV